MFIRKAKSISPLIIVYKISYHDMFVAYIAMYTLGELKLKSEFLLNRAKTISTAHIKGFFATLVYVITKRSYFVLGMKDQMWCELQIFA